VRDKDLLDPSFIYAIHVPQQNISITIRLWPMGNDNYTQKLCQTLHFNAALVKTVGDLADILVKQHVFSNDPRSSSGAKTKARSTSTPSRR
jgi:hypothetical protein